MPIAYSEEADLLETAGGIKAALPLLGEKPFLIVNGDIFTDFDFASLLGRQTHSYPHLVMVPNPAHHPKGDYAIDSEGILRSSGGEFYTYSGIGLYSPAFFHKMQPGRLMLRPLFDAAVGAGEMTGEVFAGVWTDVGTPGRYALLTEQYP
jgi:MurNAc alpha-1-phosphate uridylyltransferase